MRRTFNPRSGFRLAGLGPLPLVSIALVACAFGLATYGLGERVAGTADDQSLPPAAAASAQSIHGAAPDAKEFGRQLAGMTNQFAAQQGDDARLDRVDCVQASRGHYMCSFALLRPSRPVECHLIQAIWTPMEIDSFKVTLSGLAARCGSLREALRSLS
jgi:hypothetical protein